MLNRIEDGLDSELLVNMYSCALIRTRYFVAAAVTQILFGTMVTAALPGMIEAWMVYYAYMMIEANYRTVR